MDRRGFLAMLPVAVLARKLGGAASPPPLTAAPPYVPLMGLRHLVDDSSFDTPYFGVSRTTYHKPDHPTP